MSEWWLISEADVKTVRHALKAAIEHVENDCGQTGCTCDWRGRRCSDYYKDALHAFDSGLNETHAAPHERRWARPFFDTAFQAAAVANRLAYSHCM